MDLAAFLALDDAGRAAHLATLDAEGLVALTTALSAHFHVLDEGPAYKETVDEQEAVVAAVQAIRAFVDGGEGRADLRAAFAAATTSQRAASSPSTPARPNLAAMQQRVPAQTAPRPSAPGPVAFRATEPAMSGKYQAGQEVSWSDLGALAVDKLNIDHQFLNSGKITLAQLDWTATLADRRLQAGEGGGDKNAALVAALTSREALTAAAQAFLATNPSDREALTAAGGGICAPFPVDYAVPTFGSTARPVRDAMLRLGADRGGIQFTTPPVLKASPAADGVSVWTAADDAAVTLNPTTGVYSAPKTKPVVDYACLPETVEQVYAVPSRQSFSNFNARFNPEQVAAYLQLALVNAARLSEQILLQGIWDRSSFRVTTSSTLGAARDFLALLDTVLPQARARERLDPTAPMRCIVPQWFADMLRADLVRQMPGDGLANLAVADAQLKAFAAVRGVNLTFSMEDRDGGSAFYGRTQPTLNADGTGTAALLSFPDVVEWYLYPEGTYQFLDGGTLDLGIVRDTRTNAVNRFETFAESFEGIAKRGAYGYALRSPFEPRGTASGLKDLSAANF
ncbi:MAG: hypothetical protein JWM64_237 [Frankiales bacterium]|nr:hypothetical protein [Frankiales bacterium]